RSTRPSVSPSRRIVDERSKAARRAVTAGLVQRAARTVVPGVPPTKRTGSCPLMTDGVIAQVPAQAAVATFPAVCVPPKGSVSPLVTAPTTQKLVLNGA